VPEVSSWLESLESDHVMAGSTSFVRKFLCDPQGVGALAPATRTLAGSVARAAREAHRRAAGHDGVLQMLELGAGTGALTSEISALNPVLVEKDAAWASLLRLRFPGLEVRQECALETLASLSAPCGVVSSIPLWNNPQSGQLKQLLQSKYAEGLLLFCVLYTYGWTNPLRKGVFRHAHRASFVPRSLPPACVWIYQ